MTEHLCCCRSATAAPLPQKRADEILAEVAITLTLSGLRSATPGPTSPSSGGGSSGARESAAPRSPNVTSGFVETFGVGVSRGRYAAALRREWHRWDKQHGSENDAVDMFGRDQLFVVSGGGWVDPPTTWVGCVCCRSVGGPQWLDMVPALSESWRVSACRQAGFPMRGGHVPRHRGTSTPAPPSHRCLWWLTAAWTWSIST